MIANVMKSAVASILSSIDRLSPDEQQEIVLGILTRSNDSRCLSGLNVKELRALSDCQLSVMEQERLNDLLDRNSNGGLLVAESTELEQLVEQVDQLSLLKTRAQYTLHYWGNFKRSFFEMAGDWIGAGEGPGDLSMNPDYLTGSDCG